MFSVHTYLLKGNSVIASELNLDHVHKGVILENIEHSFIDIRNELAVKQYFKPNKKFFREAILIKFNDEVIFDFTYYDLSLWSSFASLIEHFLATDSKATEETVHYQAIISLENTDQDKVFFTVVKMNKIQLEIELPKYSFLHALVDEGLHYFTTMCNYGYSHISITNMRSCYEELTRQLDKLIE
ncbi:hypothetical protein [Brevibacillus parabrevis]|uniref:hypothetical protein n=1 Tax=Brevibacillus parabrevis TaxID=54914 RepID=UPI0028D4F30E|nr:hypothetical protein [Brevibacillus parabrevis]